MGSQHLILIVENEAPVAFDIAYAFQLAGARVVTSNSVQLALELMDAEADMWSAVVLGPTLNDIDSSQLCARLKQRDIPFLLYTGSPPTQGACSDAAWVYVHADPAVLVRSVEDLVASHGN